MLHLIDETKDGRRQFGPGHFDLVIIDEAHRSVYQKYRANLRLDMGRHRRDNASLELRLMGLGAPAPHTLVRKSPA